MLTAEVFQDEVELAVGLKGVQQAHNERVLGAERAQNIKSIQITSIAKLRRHSFRTYLYTGKTVDPSLA